MRVLIIGGLLLCLTNAATGMDPPAVEWERLYFPGYWSTFNSISETSDGGFAATMGTSVDSGYTMCRLSWTGDILWGARSGLDHQCGYSATELDNGDLIVTGWGRETPTSSVGVLLSKLDSAGQVIWTKLYNSGYPGSETGYSICLIPDGGFAVCGEIDPAEGMNQAWILRTDSQGDTLWTREWGWVMWDRARRILCIDDVIIVLCSGRLEGDPGGTYIVRYSMDGDLLSEYWIPELIGKYGFDMCEAADGGLLILTNNSPTIAHTDYYGNVDWYTQPPYWDRDNASYGWSIDTTMDGGIIYGGENRYQPPGNNFDIDPSGMIVRMDYEGSFFWSDQVYNSGCIIIYSARQLSQGGYIAAGQAWSSVNGMQGFLIKYAPETGIESADLSPAVMITSVSPNPFSSSLSITCSLPSAMSASVTVYDLNGRIVDVVEDGCFLAGEHSVSWIPSSELASGCYLIRLQTEIGTDVMNCVLLGD